jgi:hypothetical protein
MASPTSNLLSEQRTPSKIAFVPDGFDDGQCGNEIRAIRFVAG